MRILNAFEPPALFRPRIATAWLVVLAMLSIWSWRLSEYAASQRNPPHTLLRAADIMVRATDAALVALAAENVTLQRDAIAGLHARHTGAHRLDHAARLVPHDTRQLHAPGHARRPFVDLHVGAADARGRHTEQHFPGAGLARLDVAQRDAVLLR